jgi:hypothetical protein
VELFVCENRLPATKDNGELLSGSLSLLTSLSKAETTCTVDVLLHCPFKDCVEKREVRKVANVRAGLFKLLRTQESIPPA